MEQKLNKKCSVKTEAIQGKADGRSLGWSGHTFQSVWTDDNDGSFYSVLPSWCYSKVSILMQILPVIEKKQSCVKESLFIVRSLRKTRSISALQIPCLHSISCWMWTRKIWIFLDCGVSGQHPTDRGLSILMKDIFPALKMCRRFPGAAVQTAKRHGI